MLGGQLTLYRNDSGVITSVIGAHYPNITASNSVRLSLADARAIVARDLGPGGDRRVKLMIDPNDGRHFFRVETRAMASRWVHRIGAQSGAVIMKFNALTYDAHTCESMPAPCGFGVAYDGLDSTDVKNLDGLTTPDGPNNFLLKNDRQETHDQGSTNRPFYGLIAEDDDDRWDLLGDTSPAQPALVDAHYYARVADNYFDSKHGFDWVAAYGPMNIQAHFFRNYVNAFWNGTHLVFGDGDGVNFEELVSLDVVGHEIAHGVTEKFSDLIYQGESGALNESFSDMMGNSMEWYAHPGGGGIPDGGADLKETATSVSPDWTVGEDFDLRPEENGFRNMEDPEEDGDPDHYSERYTGTGDNGGVHINSGIPNHAYYLLVEGGKNASCLSEATINNHDSAYCDGTEPEVAGIGIAKAEAIFFLGIMALQSNADMCAARVATIAAANTIKDAVGNPLELTLANVDSVGTAWDAVGVTCGPPPNQAPTADAGADQTVDGGDTVTLNGSGSDPDGDDLTYFWMVTSDFGVALSDSTAQQPTFTAPTGPKTLTFKLTVSDGEFSATNQVTVTVRDPNGGAIPNVTSCSDLEGIALTTVARGERKTIWVNGMDFQDGATVAIPDRVTVQGVTFVNTSRLEVRIKVHNRANTESRNVTVTNPDGISGVETACFTVN